MKRSIPADFAGHAGELFVAAELMRRGWTVALTARNSRAFDLLASRGDKFANIRVKTKTSASLVFRWNAKPTGDIFLDLNQRNDFCVLVDIPQNEETSPIYYVVPTPFVDKWLRDDFEAWVSTPGAKGQQRATDNKVRLFYVDEQIGKTGRGYVQKLAPFKGAWRLLGEPIRFPRLPREK